MCNLILEGQFTVNKKDSTFPLANFQEQRKVWNGSAVFLTEIFQTEVSVQFPQTIFDSSFSDDTQNSTIYTRKSKTRPN